MNGLRRLDASHKRHGVPDKMALSTRVLRCAPGLPVISGGHYTCARPLSMRRPWQPQQHPPYEAVHPKWIRPRCGLCGEPRHQHSYPAAQSKAPTTPPIVQIARPVVVAMIQINPPSAAQHTCYRGWERYCSRSRYWTGARRKCANGKLQICTNRVNGEMAKRRNARMMCT